MLPLSRITRSTLRRIVPSITLGMMFFIVLPFFMPLHAQEAECQCVVELRCDPYRGGLISDGQTECNTPGDPKPCNICGGGGAPCYTYCGGLRSDPGKSDSSCYGGGSCTPSKNTCSECGDQIAEGADRQYFIETDRQLCESGAFCGQYFPVCPDGHGTPDNCDIPLTVNRGLYSTLFKQCFCGITQLAQVIINIGYTIIGSISVFMFSLGMIRYITARNDPNKITEAKQTLYAALAGLVFVLLSIGLLTLLDAELAPWGIRFLTFET